MKCIGTSPALHMCPLLLVDITGRHMMQLLLHYQRREMALIIHICLHLHTIPPDIVYIRAFIRIYVFKGIARRRGRRKHGAGQPDVRLHLV